MQPYGVPPGYGYLPTPPGAGRPGQVVASAVLGYVTAGMLLLAGLFLFFGATVINDISNAAGTSNGGYVAEFAFDGILNFTSAGLMIAGGVMVSGRDRRGRAMLTFGSVICFLSSIYWLARFSQSAILVYTILFDAPAIIALSLIFSASVTRWLAGSTTHQAQLGPPAQGPYGYL